MKIYIGFFVLALAAGAVKAQDTPPASPQPALAAQAAQLDAQAKKLAETAAHFSLLGIGPSMKNSPFSADEVNDSVQTLADGNRIVHNSTGKMYRNSEGRIRRESHGGAGWAFGTGYAMAPSVSIVDPVARQKYELDNVLKTARVYELNSGQGVTIAGAAPVADKKAAEELIAKLKAEGKLVPSAKLATMTAPTALGPINGVVAYSTGWAEAAKSKYETKTDDLGTRDFDGVSAEGTRRTTIIPAAAIGNERPIEIVYERWYSKDLGVTVYSKTTDPRSGEQTYKLTNIVRAEPDPSLFSVPTEYKKIGQSGAVYRVAPVRPEAVRTTTTPQTVVAPRPISTSGIKP
jgi:hypothetical protein